MHSQCQNVQMQISSDTAEFTGLLQWTLAIGSNTPRLRVGISTEAIANTEKIL
jgi:hypothetical protein